MNDTGTAKHPPSLLRLGTWALFFLVFAAWAGQNVFHCGPPHPLVGRHAPAFEGEIVAGDGIGDRVSLASAHGRPLVLDFWASWCPPCRASMPILSRLYARHREAGLLVIGVNVEAERDARWVSRAHASLRGGFPSILDVGWRMQAAYEVSSLPTLFLIDRRAIVRRVEIGVPSEAGLDAEIRGILSEDP